MQTIQKKGKREGRGGEGKTTSGRWDNNGSLRVVIVLKVNGTVTGDR